MTTKRNVATGCGEEMMAALAPDRHGLKHCGPAVFAAYAVAKLRYRDLRTQAIGIDEVQADLRRIVPRGPFCTIGHTRMIFKLINPFGHGANGERFQNATLHWFRKQHPEDAHLTAGLTLYICACIWWMEEQGRRSIYPALSPLCSSDFDNKLEAYGFMAGERDTLLRVLRFRPNENF